MGKHFKPEDKQQLEKLQEPKAVELKADVPSDDYYRARIKQLEAEVAGLNRDIQALEDKEEKLNGVINELHQAIKELDYENQKLKDEIIRRVVA